MAADRYTGYRIRQTSRKAGQDARRAEREQLRQTEATLAALVDDHYLRMAQAHLLRTAAADALALGQLWKH